MDDHDDHPHGTTNQPYNAAEPRPKWTPLLGVLGLVAVLALVFLLITWVRYNT